MKTWLPSIIDLGLLRLDMPIRLGWLSQNAAQHLAGPTTSYASDLTVGERFAVSVIVVVANSVNMLYRSVPRCTLDS